MRLLDLGIGVAPINGANASLNLCINIILCAHLLRAVATDTWLLSARSQATLSLEREKESFDVGMTRLWSMRERLDAQECALLGSFMGMRCSSVSIICTNRLVI